MGVGGGGGGGGRIGRRGGGDGCFCFVAATIRGWLGSGLKSVMSGWFRIRSSRSMSTGIGSVVAPAGTSSIWPARTVRNSRGLTVSEKRALPSSVVNLLSVPRLPSKMTVVPVIATVTALFLMVAPPESFGTRSRIEPLSTFAVRPALLKLKIVFAPRRVMVRSGKVSSERESSPVFMPVSSETLSSTAAGRSASSDGSRVTSRIIWVTRASFEAALAIGPGRRNAPLIIELTSIPEVIFIGCVGCEPVPELRISAKVSSRKQETPGALRRPRRSYQNAGARSRNSAIMLARNAAAARATATRTAERAGSFVFFRLGNGEALAKSAGRALKSAGRASVSSR